MIKVLYILGIILLLNGCTSMIHNQPASMGLAIPPEVELWLEPGEQSKITPRIADLAREIDSANTSPMINVLQVFHTLSTLFKYDIEKSSTALELTADELVAGGVLGECTDYALVAVTLYRAMGIPARVLYAVSAHWIDALERGSSYIPNSHAFIEVWYEGDWHLVNPSWLRMESDTDLNDDILPNGYLLAGRGHDFWDIGLHNNEDMKQRMYEVAANPGKGWRKAISHKPFPGNLCCLIDGEPPASFPNPVEYKKTISDKN